MTAYVIFQNKSGNEAGLCPKDKIHYHDKDTDDLPMNVICEFTAESWEEARLIYDLRVNYFPESWTSEQILTWVRTPLPAFNGLTPIELSTKDEGKLKALITSLATGDGGL